MNFKPLYKVVIRAQIYKKMLSFFSSGQNTQFEKNGPIEMLSLWINASKKMISTQKILCRNA